MLIVEYLANGGEVLRCSPSFLTFFGDSFIEIHSHIIKSTCEAYILVAFSMFTSGVFTTIIMLEDFHCLKKKFCAQWLAPRFPYPLQMPSALSIHCSFYLYGFT